MALGAFANAVKSSLVHEFGHALNSIMSYNHPDDRPVNTWFSEADIQALQSIWCVGVDHL